MIYLVDNIGTETGMHLYDSMFHENFMKAGKRNLVLSNYSDEHTKRLFCNFYHGSTLKKGILFAYSLIRLIIFSIIHKGHTFIYQSFGLRKIDQFFILAIRSKNKFVLVHDVFDIKDTTDEEANRKKIRFYKTRIKQIICHSERTVKDIREFGFDGKIIYFPHFRFNYDNQMKDFNENNVGEDVKHSIIKGTHNFLFFGQIRETKGIDIVLDSLQYLKGIKNLNIIIAGQDKQNMVTVDDRRFKKVLRYINNDEMMYLYGHCDYVLLPYKEIYQSGVMESMYYFKKPGIMSDVEYFANIGKSYPSLGIVYSPNNGERLASVIREICSGGYDRHKFYNSDDVNKYNEAHDATKIIRKSF